MIRALLILFSALSLCGYSQTVLDQKLDGYKRGKKLSVFLEEFEQSHPVRFYYLDEWLAPMVIEADYKDQTLGSMLFDLLRESNISFVLIHEYGVVFLKDPSYEIERRNALNSAAHEQKKIERIVIGLRDSYKPGKIVRLRGAVVNAETKLPLVGATVVPSIPSGGTTTDAAGKFELKLPSGDHVITVGFVSYQEKVIDLSVYESGEIRAELEEVPILLEEVVISSQPINELTTSRPGQLQLSVGAMKKQPSLLGEADLFRQLQVLPGVTTAGEAAAGFNVRGGSVDQNLVLYDGMPVFNTSHSLGFFSAFYSEAIREMNFYRGGVPAEYGGRVSSVLDIRSKAGNPEKWKVNGGIGLISGNLMISGPLKKNKTTLEASIRTTYADWFINSIRTSYVDLSRSLVTFYDGEIRLDHSFNERTKLTFSYYRSQDQLRVKGDTTFQWANQIGSFKLDHIFSEKLSGSFQLGLGSYQYGVTDRLEERAFNLSYRIVYPSLKSDFQYVTGRHRLSFGLQSMYYDFNPGTLKPTSEISTTRSVTMESQYSLENGIYLSDAWAVSSKVAAEAGMRFSSFFNFGPATLNVYQPGQPLTKSNLIDSVRYPTGKVITSYFGWEPRLALRYSLNEKSSVKISYNRIYQYLHLVTNTTAVTPVDIWQPSNTFFKPQKADQVSVGYFRDFKEKKYEAFVETFYKVIDNVLDFKDGAQLILNKYLEMDLLQGRGVAYGVETYFSKNTGRFTWALNYTYSRSLRTISGPSSSESINDGRTFPSSYDQPHILNASWNYRISKRYSFTGNFAYHTGRPVTVPVFGFNLENYSVAYFSGRNQYRIPDYHRLDIALVIEGNHKITKPWTGSWIISFMNVYGRRNPYSIFFAGGAGQINTYQLSIIGTIVPSITYSFKF